jgi:16S rRNA (guanine966-N2)-methyltransferase
LSRGAKGAVFFESDRSAVALLRKNIEAMKVESRSKVIPADIFTFFAKPAQLAKADFIFLDPPYRFLREHSEALRALAMQFQAHMRPGGTMIFRHDAADQLELPNWIKSDERTYGSMTLEFLKAEIVVT